MNEVHIKIDSSELARKISKKSSCRFIIKEEKNMLGEIFSIAVDVFTTVILPLLK